MTIKAFIDTNVLVYSFDDKDAGKYEQANRLIKDLDQPVINSQVIRELGNNLRKKAGFNEPSIQQVIRELYRDCTVISSSEQTFIKASQLRDQMSVSYWDSLIIAAAVAAGCTILYSEDMQHGQTVTNTTIINPFLP